MLARGRRIRKFIYIFILLISFSLRVYHLGLESYWIDEMTSVHFAKHPSIISIFWDNSPFLYHLLLKVWVNFFGDVEFSTRFLSLIFSVATTLTLMRFGDRRLGLAGAAVFGVLHAVFPLSIAYAQEARMYSLFEFAAAINLFWFDRIRFENRDGRKYIASAIFLAMTHYLALIPLFVQGVLLVASPGRRVLARKLLFPAAVAVSVVFVLSYWAFFSWSHLEWQRLGYDLEAQQGIRVFTDLFFGSLQSLMATAGLLVFGLIFGKKLGIRNEIILYGGFILGSVVLLIGAGEIGRRLVFYSRYFIFLVPIVVVLCGNTLVQSFRIGGRAVQFGSVILGVAVLTGSAFALPNVYLQTKAPWNLLAAEVGRSGSKTVYTSRSLSIESPYFERVGARVQKLRTTSTGLQDLIDGIGKCQTAWIVDTYWGGLGYIADLEKVLAAQGIEFKEHSFKTEFSEALVALQIIYPCK